MAFPTVVDAGSSSGVSTLDITHEITLPSSLAVGDRIILYAAAGSDITFGGIPAGWQTVVHALNTTPSRTLLVLARIVDGTEVGFTLTSPSSTTVGWRAYRITGAHASTAMEAATSAAASTTVDPPNLDPAGWGVEDTLWLVVQINNNGGTVAPSAPTNYTNFTNDSVAGSTGTALTHARRQLAAASEDPGAFGTLANSRSWVAATIAVRPAPATLLAGTTRQIRYDVRGRAGKTAQILYDISTELDDGLAGKQAQIKYNIAGLAGTSRDLSYFIAIPTPPPPAISVPSGLTEEQAEAAMLRGQLGQIEYRYRLWKSNNLGEKIEELGGVEEASFSLDNMRDHTWELSLPMDVVEELDIWGDWVKLEVEMSTASGLGSGSYTVTRPFGLYFFDQRAGEDAPERRQWELGGKSAEARLMGSTAAEGYAIGPGEGILATVRTLLLDLDVPASMIVLPPSGQDVAMTSWTYFDPFNNATDTRWLRIINTILAAGGFLALYADNDGRLRTRKINPSNRIEASHTYGTTPDSDRMIVSETIPYTFDDENFANRVVVYSGDPTEAASYGVAENHDPNSRVSYERLGYWVQKQPIELPSLVSPTEAQMVATQALRVASGMSLRLSFETIFDTRIQPRQAYGLEVFDDNGDAIWTSAVWPVLNVNASLDLSPMSHEVQIGIEL